MLRFNLAGVPVTIHGSFLLVAALFGLGRMEQPTLMLSWMLVVVGSVLFHELGHALAFRAYGQQPTIELHGLGGTTTGSQRGQMTPTRSLVVALAGPAAGFVLGALAYGLQTTGPHAGFAGAVLQDLWWANVAWSIFNLMPVLPLDGGAAVAAITRRFNGDQPPKLAYVVSVAVGAGLTVLAGTRGQYFTAVLLATFVWRNWEAIKQLNQKTDESSPTAHASVAPALQALNDGRLDEAMKMADQVLRDSGRREDQQVALHVMAGVYIRAGRPQDAVKILEHLPEGMQPSAMTLGDAWLGAGQVNRALTHYRDAFRSQPGKESARRLVAALLQANLADEVRALLSSEDSLTYSDETAAGLAEGLFKAAWYEEALHVHAFRYNRHGSMPAAYNAACAAMRLGRQPDALTWLATAVDKGFKDRIHLEADPDLAPLRETDGFKAIVSRLAPAQTA